MDESRPISEISEALLAFVRAFQGGQIALAKKAGVSQSTVSRFLSHPTRARLSSGLKKLCSYAGVATVRAPNEQAADPCQNQELVAALREVWDGTPSHARAIAKVIRDLKAFR